METLHPDLYDGYLDALARAAETVLMAREPERSEIAADAEDFCRQHWAPRAVERPE